MDTMSDIYFDISTFKNNMQIRILKSGYMHKDKYYDTYVSYPCLNYKEEFGIMELSKIFFGYVKDSSLPNSINRYAEIEMVKLDEPMRNKGYGRILYDRALDEIISMGLDGLASEDFLRNEYANRLYNNCRTIEFCNSTFTIYEKKKWHILDGFKY